MAVPDQGTFRLVDLLAVHGLGLHLMTEGDPDTPLLGAHAIEVENPSRWMKPGWLMLTTGARFGGPGEYLDLERELVRELSTAGIAALAFGVGIYHGAVPSALVDEAERCDLPLLSVPLETPFLEVIDVVHRATLTADVYLQRRTVHIQDYLLESLAEHDPLSALVYRLAELLRGSVVLYDQSGNVMASSGVGPTQTIRNEIAGRPVDRRSFAVGRWHVLADPIRTDTVLQWLAVASRRRSVSEDLVEPAMEAARRVVTMIVRSRASIRTEDRLRCTELLRMVTSGEPASPYVWDRLEMHGFRRDDEIRMLALTEAAPDSPSWHPWRGANERAGLVASLQEAATEAEMPLLVATDEDRVLALAGAAQSGLRRWWANVPRTTHCGMSEPFHDLSLGPVRRREAELALASAQRSEQRMLAFERIGLVDWLIAARDPESVRAKARQVLTPISDRPPLLGALREYLRFDCDVQRTARALGLHPNSVRYRLKQVSASTGCDLRSPAALAELSLSMRLLEGEPSPAVIRRDRGSADGDGAPK